MEKKKNYCNFTFVIHKPFKNENLGEQNSLNEIGSEHYTLVTISIHQISLIKHGLNVSKYLHIF